MCSLNATTYLQNYVEIDQGVPDIFKIHEDTMNIVPVSLLDILDLVQRLKLIRNTSIASMRRPAQFLCESGPAQADRIIRRIAKTFCEQKELIINASKTPLVLFKSSRKKLPDDS